MKHATSRLLFAYWDKTRGERAAPDRADVKPGEMRHVLADTFILGLDGSGAGAFRLAGTRCEALFGRDLKGATFDSLWPPETRAEPDRMVEAVTFDTTPVVAGLIGTSEAGAKLGLELLLLPLKHHGSLRARALGALSPASVPSWLGLVPLASLETQSLRIVRAEPLGPGEPAESPVKAAERRSRFVVLDGGLAR